MAITLGQLRYCQHRIWLRKDELKCSLLKDADGSALISSLHYCNAEDCPVAGAFKLHQQSIDEQVDELVKGL